MESLCLDRVLFVTISTYVGIYIKENQQKFETKPDKYYFSGKR